VRLWDLPGAGTPNFPRDTYLTTMGLRYFDLVIVVSATRFTEIDEMLIRELEHFRIPFFAVRTKVDVDIHNNMRDYDKSPQDTVDELMNESVKQGIKNPYLICGASEPRLHLPYLMEDIGKEIEKRRKIQMPVPSSAPGTLPAFESPPQPIQVPYQNYPEYPWSPQGQPSTRGRAPDPRPQPTKAQGSGPLAYFNFPLCDARNRESSCASLRSMSSCHMSVAEEGLVHSPHGGLEHAGATSPHSPHPNYWRQGTFEGVAPPYSPSPRFVRQDTFGSRTPGVCSPHPNYWRQATFESVAPPYSPSPRFVRQDTFGSYGNSGSHDHMAGYAEAVF